MRECYTVPGPGDKSPAKRRPIRLPCFARSLTSLNQADHGVQRAGGGTSISECRADPCATLAEHCICFTSSQRDCSGQLAKIVLLRRAFVAPRPPISTGVLPGPERCTNSGSVSHVRWTGGPGFRGSQRKSYCYPLTGLRFPHPLLKRHKTVTVYYERVASTVLMQTMPG